MMSQCIRSPPTPSRTTTYTSHPFKGDHRHEHHQPPTLRACHRRNRMQMPTQRQDPLRPRPNPRPLPRRRIPPDHLTKTNRDRRPTRTRIQLPRLSNHERRKNDRRPSRPRHTAPRQPTTHRRRVRRTPVPTHRTRRAKHPPRRCITRFRNSPAAHHEPRHPQSQSTPPSRS